MRSRKLAMNTLTKNHQNASCNNMEKSIDWFPSTSDAEHFINLLAMLQAQDFDPTLEVGCILIDEYGIPACHIYLHVDGILVCGSTYDKTCAALDFILECTVRVRVICQPVKT
jgi:hypothetical protein